MPFRSPATLDRFVPVLTAIRADLDTGARAAAPGCVLVVFTAIGGAMALAYGFRWNSGWHTDPATLAGLAAYVAAVWLIWKAGRWWATPGVAAAAGASRRLETHVLQPLIHELRPGARYDAGATAPRRTLARSHLVRDQPFTAANQIRWRAGDLDLEMFEVESIVSTSVEDCSRDDRYFVGLLAWAELPGNDGGLHAIVRSRHEFANGVAGPWDGAALDGFAVNTHYRVISNWEPFARAVCTPHLQDRLLRLAAEGTWVHAAVADGRVWVGIEVEKDSWFRRYPTWSVTLARTLDNDHVALLERQITIVEDLAIELARADRARAGA